MNNMATVGLFRGRLEGLVASHGRLGLGITWTGTLHGGARCLTWGGGSGIGLVLGGFEEHGYKRNAQGGSQEGELRAKNGTSVPHLSSLESILRFSATLV
jgi:hypothetical protein